MNRSLFAFLVLNILYLRANSAVIDCRKPEWLLCDNMRCVSSGFECDGENDCGDMSDEKNCDNFKASFPTVKCASDEYQCKDHACIPAEKFCDTTIDCPDKSDEYDGCVKELKCTTFRCNDGHCIRNEWVCDGVKDCADNSDEMNCANKTIPASECNNEIDRYLCKNERCIPLSVVCNEKNDCGDGSDENADGCKNAEPLCKDTAKCEHFCRKTPEGPKCACKSGYQLINNRTCEDVDECKHYGTCDQLCVNNVGSYTCACQSGYNLQDDKRTCKAEGGEALMVFSVKSEIRGFYLNSEVYFPITRNLKHAVAVSLDSNYIYWSDIEDGNEAIIRSREDESEREVIVTTGLSTPSDIAVDWVTGNIYFSDSDYMHIGVCTNEGSYCTIIVQQRNTKPRGLALLPSNGIMYWSEWGSNPSIWIAGMDGKNSSAFITENLEWPNGVTIDYANNRLYWVDAKLKVIESIRLDGSDRRVVLKEVAKKPFSLAVFENKLYWSDWSSNTIQSCDKFTGKDWKILLSENNTVYGIHVYHSLLKPKIANPCNAKPCSQLCLLNRNSGYTCACTIDKELSSDQHTCTAVKKKQHLVIAAGRTFIDYYHELLGKPKMTASVILKHITALTYNSLTGAVLASDQLTDNIFQFNTNSQELKSMMSLKNEMLGGMDFDYIGNNLYLSDIEHKTIEVHSLSTNEKTVFYFQDQPYDIALVPEEGVMFVVFRANGKYRIDKMRMNGFGARYQIAGYKSPLLGPKVSLCYDRDLKRIFWSDQGSGRIESVTITGDNAYLFRTGLLEPVSLAILGGQIFWTQSNSKQLYWADKSNIHQYQKHITIQVPEDSSTLHLVAMRGIYVNKNHGCSTNNGNCSHVCLVSNNNAHICACPPDMMLGVDNRTCNVQTACSVGETKCGEHDVCIKLHQRCDGIQDCPNGEDESSYCADFNACANDQFKCKSGECINVKQRCNSHYDCTDRSDEDDCDKKECETNEFQCHEGSCISKYMVCNGQNDCSDLSDEINCGTHTCDGDSFMCDTRTCIPRVWKCDGEVDCPDSSDEGEACQTKACSSEMFTCHNARCIDLSLKCNGIDDCGDDSDEHYCAQNKNMNLVNCTEDEYKCYNTDMCLPKILKCNGVQDCPKNDDEHDCPRCRQEEFVCDNKNCIHQSWVCDMHDDCNDASDERDCDGRNTKKINSSILSSCKEFTCMNGACLPFSKVCDGISDCSDQSDEFGKCAISCVKENPCQSKCNKTPLGPVCGCQNGYQLSDDLKSCEDLNECEHNICSQICYNTVGSFTCSCHEGYVLRNDRTSCKVAGSQMDLITAVGSSIRSLSPSLDTIKIIEEELNSDISGIDANAKEQAVYWSNDALGMISKIYITNKERKTVTGLGKPEALAVDWVTDNVYFNDNDHPCSIKVCNLEQQKCAQLVTIGGRSKLTSIAVDPKHGWLFWSQTRWLSSDGPSTDIYRTSTLGTNKTLIAFRNIGVVSGLAIDYMRSRLYWADTFFKTIEVSNLDGSNRALFSKTNAYQPLSISIYEDSLYWLMGTTGTIKKCQLHANTLCTTIDVRTSNIDRFFTILHSSRQPLVENRCKDHKCDYMCILESDDFACVCQNGLQKGHESKCTTDLNMQIKFASHIAHGIRQQSGTLIGVIVTVVTGIVVLSGYCYYKKITANFSKKDNLSIHFQNPSYDHRNDTVSSLNCMSNLPPGEHEYINPIINISTNKKPEMNDKKIPEFLHFDTSDGESDNSENKQNTRLIH